MPVWRLLNSGRGDGVFNMAVDETLLAHPGPRPVLRLYSWDPPAISLGHAQDPSREVDVEKCRVAGLDLVRRPTGGRAVLHWDELTYSIICRQDDAALGGCTEDTYCRIGHCLVEGLRGLGVAAELERTRPRPVSPRSAGIAAPCFSSTARWEVKYKGRKLVGSAQRRTRGAILQHGSLPLGAHYRRLPEFLPEAMQHLRPLMARQLEQGSIHLRACMGREVEWGELVANICEGLRRHLGVEFESDQLDGEEKRRIAALVRLRRSDMTPVDLGAAAESEGQHLVSI
jgi:lipoate-protein ligase A